jgi:hypothetical protein
MSPLRPQQTLDQRADLSPWQYPSDVHVSSPYVVGRMVTRPHASLQPMDDRELELVVDVAQSAIAQEFAIAQRVDEKVRAALGSATAWFAVSSGLSGAILTRAKPVSAGWRDLVIVFAVMAVVALVVAGVQAYSIWSLQTQEDFAPAALFEMAAVARDPDDALADKLVASYANTLASRRENNKTRADVFRKSMPWVATALLATLVELLAALFGAAFS